MSAREEELAAAVAELGALPVPVGPEPQALIVERLQAELAVSEQRSERRRIAWRMARTRALSLAGAADRAGDRVRSVQTALQDMLESLLTMQIERDAALARVAELEAEREQLRQLPSLPLDKLAKALLLMETGPALAWAHAMSDHDLHGFLDDLVSAAMGRWQSDPEVPDRTVLANVERVCATWRTPGLGNRLDGSEFDGVTVRIAPSQVPCEVPDVEDELTGANLSLYEEEQENARLRLALKSAQRGRSELRELVRQMCAALNGYDCPPPGETPFELVTRVAVAQGEYERIVAEFVADRAGYIVAIRNCHPDNGHDYDRWQGHAAARRQLAEALGLPVAWPPEDDVSVAKSADKLTALLAPTQALREVPDGEHAAWVRHSYRTPHDLPETGGA